MTRHGNAQMNVVRFGSARGKVRLFCFPYAGGSSAAFASWHKKLPDDVEVWAVELPGRGSRLGEQPRTDLHSVLRECLQVVASTADKPFAFFGHSMGALVAYELARELQRTKLLIPNVVIVSGLPAPNRLSAAHDLPLEQDNAYLIEKLRAWGGTPPELLQDEEAMQILLTVLHSDLSLYNSYRFREVPALRVPIAAFGGRQDPETTVPDLAAWAERSERWLGTRLFPGDHFFIRSSEVSVLSTIVSILTKVGGLEEGSIQTGIRGSQAVGGGGR